MSAELEKGASFTASVGGALLGLWGITFSEAVAMCGLLVTIGGLGMNFYFKRKHFQLALEKHEMEMKEARDG